MEVDEDDDEEVKEEVKEEEEVVEVVEVEEDGNDDDDRDGDGQEGYQLRRRKNRRERMSRKIVVLGTELSVMEEEVGKYRIGLEKDCSRQNAEGSEANVAQPQQRVALRRLHGWETRDSGH
ncbi:hypothetical protein RRG08_015729 [Elysia crispata]|uniref:Uncharacterized protein n=1 Tax=Elysia crispata TaxID=231223 RepID=A0AAE1DB52_9GAST|nr:hypothetical protein RRG08_015729 [Elysia crispata]